MAISSSSDSNSIGSPFSPSSSNSSVSSLDSISESREPTPEYDPTAAHEALAPLHWDAEEFDFGVVSEDDEPKTNGEDLRLLLEQEPEVVAIGLGLIIFRNSPEVELLCIPMQRSERLVRRRRIIFLR